MAQAKDRMPPHHARAGIPHHGPHLFASGGLVAMDRAFGADRLLQPKAAPIEPDGGIIQQPLTLGTQRRVGGVLAPAVTGDHRRDGLPFPGQALARESHGDCPAAILRRPRTRGFDWFRINHHRCQVRLEQTA
jgi:hypothetical protein